MGRFFTYPFLIRTGLAFVFLANSLIAFFEPGEFIEILNQSFLANLLPVGTGIFVTFIGVNDALVALLLFTGISKFRVAVWASLWIFGVMLVRGLSIETLEEVGFLFMAVALAVDNSKQRA